MEQANNTQIVKNNPLSRNKGFTLIEVMVAVAILAIGILAVSSMQMHSVEGNSLAGNTTEAVTVAENELERLIGLPYTHNDLQDVLGDGAAGLRNPLPPLPAPPIPDLTLPALNPDYQVPRGRYTVCWNVAFNNDFDLPPLTPAVSNTKTINVIVVWRQGSEDKAIILEYIKSRDDLFF